MVVSRGIAVFFSIFLLAIFYSLTSGNVIDRSPKPGVGVRITKSGLSYAAQTTLTAAIKKLETTGIPDKTGNILGGLLSYNISGISFSSLSKPRSTVKLNWLTGVTWHLKNISFDLGANFKVTLFKHLHEWHGGLSLSMENVSLSIPFDFGTDKKGHPTEVAHCEFERGGNWAVNFSGPSAGCLGRLVYFFRKATYRRIQKSVCSAITSAINTRAARSLPTYPVFLDVGSVFQIDYSVLGSPSYTASSLTFPLRGEVFLKKKRSRSTVTPSGLPPFSENSRMVYFLMTDYVFRSLSDVAFRQGLLDKNVTNRDLPPDQSYFLNTTCPGNLCLGKLIAQTATMFPNGQAEMRIKSTERPEMEISNESVAINFSAKAEFYVNQPNKNATYMFSIKANLDTQIHVLPNEISSARKVTAAISQTSLSVTLLDTAIGAIAGNLLKTLVGTIVNLYIRPQLDKLGAVGIPLPDLGKKIRYIRPTVNTTENAVIVAVDVKFSKVSEKPRDFLLFDEEMDEPEMSFQAVDLINAIQPMRRVQM